MKILAGFRGDNICEQHVRSSVQEFEEETGMKIKTFFPQYISESDQSEDENTHEVVNIEQPFKKLSKKERKRLRRDKRRRESRQKNKNDKGGNCL